MKGNAVLSNDATHVILTQQTPKMGRDPQRQTTLRARNVAAKRDDEFAQIEVEVASIYPGSVRTAGSSVSLTRDAAIALAASVLGIGPNRFRALIAADLARAEEAREATPADRAGD